MWEVDYKSFFLRKVFNVISTCNIHTYTNKHTYTHTEPQAPKEAPKMFAHSFISRVQNVMLKGYRLYGMVYSFFPFIHWKFKFMEHCCSACTVHTFIVWSILLINIFIAIREVRKSIERRQPSSKNNNLINVAVALFLLFLFFGHVVLLLRYPRLSIDFQQ